MKEGQEQEDCNRGPKRKLEDYIDGLKWKPEDCAPWLECDQEGYRDCDDWVGEGLWVNGHHQCAYSYIDNLCCSFPSCAKSDRLHYNHVGPAIAVWKAPPSEVGNCVEGLD
jgi:hypothetical protein